MKFNSFYLLSLSVILSSFNSNGQGWKEYIDSARTLRDLRQYNAAIVLYNEARKYLVTDSALTNTSLEINNSLGEMYLNEGALDSAYIFFKRAKTIIEKIRGGQNADYANNISQLGLIYFRKGLYDLARKYFTEAMLVREKVFTKKHPMYATSCNFLGNVYSETGRYDKAEVLYQTALQIREKNPGKSSAEYAQSCNNLGDLYRKVGMYEKAEPFAVLAKEIRANTPGKKHFSYAISCTNLANLYRDMGQFKKAEENYVEAKEVREKVFTKMHADYAKSCNILADLYCLMKEYSKAEALYFEAMEIREKTITKEHRDYAQSCNNLGILYIELESYDKAEELLLQARTIWKKALDSDDPAIAINNNILANLYLAKDHFNKAEAFFRLALHFWEKKTGKDHPSYIQNLIGLAKVSWNKGKFEEADRFYRQSFAIQYNQISQVFRFTNETEKQQYLNNVLGSIDEYLSFYYKWNSSRANEAYNMSLLNRNLILSSSQEQRKAIHGDSDSSLLKLYNEWTKLKQQLAFFMQSNSKTEEIKITEAKADSIEKVLSRGSASFRKLQAGITWRRIQQNLLAKEASVEFINFRYFNGKRWTDSVLYAALLIRKDKPSPELIPLFESKELDTVLIKGIKTNIASRGVSISGVAEDYTLVYSLVWKPMEKHLSNISTVYFAPSGNLFKIPFAALSINDNEILSDKYRLVQLNTTAAVTDNEPSYIKKFDKIQLYGGIVYDTDSTTLKNELLTHKSDEALPVSLPFTFTRGQTFSFLPGTEEEVSEVKKLADEAGVEAIVLSQNDATEESFKALNSGPSPAVLHIATHGFFFLVPKRKRTLLLILTFNWEEYCSGKQKTLFSVQGFFSPGAILHGKE